MTRRGKMRIRIGKSVVVIGLAGLAISLNAPARAAQLSPSGHRGGAPADVSALQQQVTTLIALVTTLQARLTALEQANVQALNPYVSVLLPPEAPYPTSVLSGESRGRHEFRGHHT